MPVVEHLRKDRYLHHLHHGCTSFGVFFAAPLRHPMIIKEKLVFPSGTATAQLIGVLHRIPLDMLSQGKSQKQRSGELRHRTTTSRRPSHGQASIGQENCDVSAERISGRQSEYQHESRSNGDDAEQGVMESGAGWKTLLWSFAGSAMFTVRPLSTHLQIHPETLN